MRLAPDGSCDDFEVNRLAAWLDRRWFDTLPKRQQFKTLHPECAGWSWTRIGRERLAYEVVDAEKCVTTRIS